MTIQFNCPNCDALIAFDSKHRGKRARCQTCQQLFIIPYRDDETPRKIEPKIEKGQPIPGFYRAVFVDSWKIFVGSASATPLVFVAVAVCLKFFLGHLIFTIVIPGRSTDIEFPLPLGIMLTIAMWGFLFWYYMQIIYSTAFDADQLPEVLVGGFRGLMWKIYKSVYLFIIVLMVVEMPFIIAMVISKKIGVEWPVLLLVLRLGGLFLFPMAILTTAIGKDLTMLRPDYIILPIFRAFKPYLVVTALLVVFGILEMHTKQFNPSKVTFLSTTGKLICNLALQIIAIIAMRSIGLFYRHYTCHLPW